MNRNNRVVRRWASLSLLMLATCRSHPPDPSAQKPSADAEAVANAADASVEVTSQADAEASAEDAAAAPDEPLEGTLYTAQARAAFRVAACGGDDTMLPPRIDKKLVDTHCAMLESGYDEYKREWLDVAKPFIAKLRPAGLPKTVVYPFGGGDLVSALATYPDATEITTVSLEIAGDVRAIDKAVNKRLEGELAQLRDHLGKLFLKAHSRTANLDTETHGAIPGEVAFTMAALAIHGFEPVTLRYFKFRTDGALRYLTEQDLNKGRPKPGEEPDASKPVLVARAGPFANAEIRFRKAGDATAKVRVLRHVAYDLSDKHLRSWPALLKHLEAKGKVSAMTKAATYLLWDDENFSVIRAYLMKHTDWMISDTTGVPPRIAKKYGFVQDAYGAFDWPEPFGRPNNFDAQAFHDLFRTATPIAFRYGYPDNKSHGHIVVTHKPDIVAKP